ncbi:V-type ATP synthase subunit K [bacterium]|nr:V-type ATP synthase subunit K [bacterium]
MEAFWQVYFTHTGIGWAVMGAMIAVAFGGAGSARGIRVAAGQAAGVLSEKPEMFGKLLVLMALPGTQGFYGFIVAIFTAQSTGLLAGKLACTPMQGVALMAVGICSGVVLYRSAVYQGEAAAAAINLTSRRPEQAGRSILMPALVETYAVVALLAAILFTLWICKPGIAVALTPAAG